MDSFNLQRIRGMLPDISNVQLPSFPKMHSSMNPDGDDEEQADATDPSTASQEQPKKSAAMVIAEPKPIQPGPKSNIDLLNECDSFPYYEENPKLYFAYINTYYALQVAAYPEVVLGYVLPSVAEIFRGLPDWKVDDDDSSLTLITGKDEPQRSKAVAFTTAAMRATNHFNILKGWRDELYPVYGPKGELLFSIERAASALFGVVTYGVHMTCYTRSEKNGIKIWVPRRAKTKSTYGGMLDNTVAGGIATGEKPFESIVREAGEEASLDEELVRDKARQCGAVTYFHIRDHRAGGETKLLQPECQYVYDLQLPSDVVPKPSDDEVEEFYLWSVDEVKQCLKDGEFKPNCALVLLDFFVRHGILTTEDEGYLEIAARLHRRLEFPMP